jgi:hypothetical protein
MLRLFGRRRPVAPTVVLRNEMSYRGLFERVATDSFF